VFDGFCVDVIPAAACIDEYNIVARPDTGTSHLCHVDHDGAVACGTVIVFVVTDDDVGVVLPGEIQLPIRVRVRMRLRADWFFLAKYRRDSIMEKRRWE